MVGVAAERVDRVLVIGAGVTGLTTALELSRAGFEVIIVADKMASECVSVVAGALWEWPPAVCGHHQDQVSLARSKDWAMQSYEIFGELAQDPAATGVHLRYANFYFTHRIEEHAPDLHKMRELAPRLRGFSRDPDLAPANGVSPASGVVDAYRHIAPAIDTDRYTDWLLDRVREAGVEIVRDRINGLLVEQERRLRDVYRVQAVVNCTGLGAGELHGQPVFPLRGALVRVRNDGTRIPHVDQAHCVSHDRRREGEQDVVFIVPRGADMLMLGGLVEMNEWSTDITLDNYQPIRDMYERCLTFMPILAKAEIDSDEPVRAGLRPFRPRNVCLEREPDTMIIHNYGHGGSGFSFSWGCAREVVDMLKRVTVGR